MARRHSSSRKKKKIASDIPSKPTASLTDAMRQERDADGAEVFANVEIPKKPVQKKTKNRIKGAKIRVRTPRTAREVGRVYVKNENDTKSFDAEMLRCITSSTTSLNFESVCTDRSFERHKREGVEIDQAPEMVLDSQTIAVIEPQKEESNEEEYSGVSESIPPVINSFDHPEFADLLVCDNPPKYGDFQKISSQHVKVVEEEEVIKETMLSTLDEFFAAKIEGLALTIQVKQSGNRPILKIQLEKGGDGSANTSSLSRSLSEFDEESVNSTKKSYSRVENHFFSGRRRDYAYGGTLNGSFSGSTTSFSSGCGSSSGQISDTVKGATNEINSSKVCPSNSNLRGEYLCKSKMCPAVKKETVREKNFLTPLPVIIRRKRQVRQKMSLGETLTTDRNAPTINSRKQRIYDDFSSPTAIRQDRIIVENKSIYVNLGYLAEYSSFFANSYERKESPIRLNNNSYEDILELMRCLFFCPQRKEITHANISTIIDLANEFDMEPVMRRCEDVISRQAGSFSPNRIFQLTRSLSKYHRNSHSMSVLMDKLARMDEHQLNTLPFDNIPGDVVADLYAVKLRQSVENRRQKCGLPWWKRAACCCPFSSVDKEHLDKNAKNTRN